MKLCSLLLGTVVANYNTYTIPIDSDLEFTWSSSDNFMEYIAMEGDKEHVKYQAPDDEYVPIDDLPIVYLNGIRFHRQGKEPRPGSLERFRKMTRSSSGKLVCQDQKLVKEERVKEKVKFHKKEEELSDPRLRGLDLSAKIFQTIQYPRYNGRLAPLPYDELMTPSVDLSDMDPENEEEKEVSQNPTLDLAHLSPSDGFPSEEFIEPEDDDEKIAQMAMDMVDVEELNEPPENEEEEALSDEELRLKRLKKKFYAQENVKIGCCNGQPYNTKKRCCCRRVSFDKDKKFCCAINGCQSFQIFDRNNAQHYKDCLSLRGLVIQEYGYQGQVGQPKMFSSAARPSRPQRP